MKNKNKLDYIIINLAEPTHSKNHNNVGAVYGDCNPINKSTIKPLPQHSTKVGINLLRTCWFHK